MYTSGSTGTPKGVVVSHRAVNRLVINNGYVRIGPADCIAHCSNTAFDASTFEIWGALLNGARVLIVPQPVLLDVVWLGQVLKYHGGTILFLTTALFHQHACALPAMFESLNYLLFGGEACDPGIVRKLLHEGSPKHVLNAYGPTETTTFATSFLTTAVADGATSLPIGRPISNTQVYILDSRMQPVPIGVAGEIYIGGAGVSPGYLHRPDLTAQRFIADPFSTDPHARLYRSGDSGRWRADGNIEFLGRKDQQVKLRGFRIELGEIEAHLLQHAHVKEAVVLAREDEPGYKRLVAYVAADVTQPDKHLRQQLMRQLRRHLQERLPEYMIPAAWMVLERLPLTPNGKVDRRALPAPSGRSDELGGYVPPRTELERALAHIWKQVLHVAQVGMHDSFFELGGTSLSATRVIADIRDSMQVDLPLRELFDSRTLEELSLRIELEMQERDAKLRAGDLALSQEIGELSDEEVLARIAALERELHSAASASETPVSRVGDNFSEQSQ